MPALWHAGLVSAKFGGQASAISITVVLPVFSRSAFPQHSTVDLALMEGCNHWVGGGQPRELILPWRPCVNRDPMSARRSGYVTIWPRAFSCFCRYGQESH